VFCIVNTKSGDQFKTRNGISVFKSVRAAKQSFSTSVDEVNAEVLGLSLIPYVNCVGVINYRAPKFYEQKLFVIKECND
jgi:hypothetical protein